MSDMVMVPREPTIGMMNEGWQEIGAQGFVDPQDVELDRVWSAMLAAAPVLPAPSSEPAVWVEPSPWYVEHRLAEAEGFGASYSREQGKWHLYSMPGAKPFGSIYGYDKASIDFVCDALRAALRAQPAAPSSEPVAWRLRRVGSERCWNLWDLDPRADSPAYADATEWEVQPLYAHPPASDDRMAVAAAVGSDRQADPAASGDARAQGVVRSASRAAGTEPLGHPVQDVPGPRRRDGRPVGRSGRDDPGPARSVPEPGRMTRPTSQEEEMELGAFRASRSIPGGGGSIGNAQLAAELQAVALAIRMFGLDGLTQMSAPAIPKEQQNPVSGEEG